MSRGELLRMATWRQLAIPKVSLVCNDNSRPLTKTQPRDFAMQHLTDRVAVVTGAASGIGLAMAQRFAREGMRLVLADIEPDRLASALTEVQALGAEAIAVVIDVGVEAQVNALADAAFARFGAIHLLCNNAGVSSPALTSAGWQSPLSDWQWILQVNLMGVLYGLRAFVPRMLQSNEEGHIVNTASVAGLITAAHPYHVSKHAVACITEGLYKDFKRGGAKLSASVLCPGLIRTEILHAERTRAAEFGPPTDLSQAPETVQHAVAAFAKALDAGYEPSQVADAVVDGIRADQFYIIPAQPALHDMVTLRMQDIVARRNPTLPAQAAIRAKIDEGLRSGEGDC